jgi:hypothetical protein
MLARYTHHSEFVRGVAFDLFEPTRIATASWDDYCTVFDFVSGVPPVLPRGQPSSNPIAP